MGKVTANFCRILTGKIIGDFFQFTQPSGYFFFMFQSLFKLCIATLKSLDDSVWLTNTDVRVNFRKKSSVFTATANFSKYMEDSANSEYKSLIFVLNTASSNRIWHVLVGWGGGGGVFGPPPLQAFLPPKNWFFSLWKRFFWISFASPMRSFWVKQADESHPKNSISQREKSVFRWLKSLVGGGGGVGPKPRLQKNLADYRSNSVRCLLIEVLPKF